MSHNIPTQKHGKGRGSKAVAKTDRKQSHLSNVKGTKGPEAQSTSMATQPQGTRVMAPGGRASRANIYATPSE